MGTLLGALSILILAIVIGILFFRQQYREHKQLHP